MCSSACFVIVAGLGWAGLGWSSREILYSAAAEREWEGDQPMTSSTRCCWVSWPGLASGRIKYDSRFDWLLINKQVRIQVGEADG